MIFHEIRESGLKELDPIGHKDLLKICKKHKVTLSEAIDAIAQEDVGLMSYGGDKDPNDVMKEIKAKIDALIKNIKEKHDLVIEIQSIEVQDEDIRYGLFRLVNSVIFNPKAEFLKEFLSKHDGEIHKNKADAKAEAEITGI